MTATITHLPCDQDPDDQYVGASRPVELTQPLPAVKQRSIFSGGAQLQAFVNADTEITAEKCDSGHGEYLSVTFYNARCGTRLSIAIEEADLLRLWMHAEAARRSEASA